MAFIKPRPWFWVGNTSRDEFVGAIFGLGAAYDLIDDPTTKSGISDLVTRLTAFLTGHNWSITLPDGSTTTSFLSRPDELLAILEVAKHVNSSKFSTYYSEQKLLFEATVPLPIGFDIISDDSYFKYNLASMCFYNLLRLDGADPYQAAYSLLRGHTGPQQNAFFDIVDRALSGPDTARDQETRNLLEQWLQRTKRDPFTDATKLVADCGSAACLPIPLLLRPPADFLWQVSPYQLSGGGSSIVEGAGIDYILPYWMARYYGVISPSPVTSSAATTSTVAPNSFATLFGSNLANTTATASVIPLPLSLGGVMLTVTDSAGVARPAGLVYASPTQINFVVPDGTSPGAATSSRDQRIKHPNLRGNCAERGPAVVQHEQHGHWCRRRHGPSDTGERKPSVACNGVPVLQRHLLLCADRAWRRYADLRFVLRHRHPWPKLSFQRSHDHRRHFGFSPIRRCADHLPRAGSGKRPVALELARRRGIECGSHCRRPGFKHDHHPYPVNF